MQENFLFDNLTKLTKWRFTTVGSPFSSDDFDGFSGCMDFELFRSSFEKQLSRSSEREDETECLLKNDIFPALERICLKTREILLETVLNGKHFEKPTMAIVKDLSGVFADGFAENREYRIVEFYERIGRKYLKLTDGCGHSVVLNAARVEFA